MGEEITQNVSDPRPFEERVLTLLDSMNTRLKILEEQSERRAMDMKPIWERALAEIHEVNEKVSNLERKFDVLTHDMMQLRGDQRRLNARMDKLESKPV